MVQQSIFTHLIDVHVLKTIPPYHISRIIHSHDHWEIQILATLYACWLLQHMKQFRITGCQSVLRVIINHKSYTIIPSL
jgi:hypothetical protein